MILKSKLTQTSKKPPIQRFFDTTESMLVPKGIPRKKEETPPAPKPIPSAALRDARGAFRAGNQARLRHGVYAEFTVQPDEQEIFLVFRTALSDQFTEELGVDGILLDVVALQFVHHARCMMLGNYGAVQLIQPLISPWLDRLKITRSAREHGNKRKPRNALDFFADVLKDPDAPGAPGAADGSDGLDACPPDPPFAPPPPDPDAPATSERIAVIREQVQRDLELKNARKVSHNTGKPPTKIKRNSTLF
jgi:hypothetical protein